MGRYHARYVREHYVKRDIKRELYEAFIEWCGERSINICLEKALSILRGNITLNVRGNVTHTSGSITTTTGDVGRAPTKPAKTGENRRVIAFSLDWARQKGINVEEYMARKERQGYICNDTASKVYCIWREDIEQIIVELNSSNAEMGDLERVLSGEKLEIARAAVEAGLMWYDSKEKRWRAPL
jgi:hypothetical protein